MCFQFHETYRSVKSLAPVSWGASGAGAQRLGIASGHTDALLGAGVGWLGCSLLFIFSTLGGKGETFLDSWPHIKHFCAVLI